MAAVDEHFIVHEEALDDLYSWIDTIPLSRPKKNIARDFSDGVLCAEIIAHFQPKIVDMHNYFPASSAMQKKINWNTLNRKVFAKMGIRLTDNTIQQLIDAKPGAVEQVLWDVHRKLNIDNSNNMNQLLSYRGRPATAPNSSQHSGRSSSSSSRYDTVNRYDPKFGQQDRMFNESIMEYQDESGLQEPRIHVIHGASKLPMTSPSGQVNTNPPTPTSGYRMSAPSSGSIGTYRNSFSTQGYVAGSNGSSYGNDEAANNNSSAPPNQILYRGHKMVPLGLLEEREREIKNLEAANKSIAMKLSRNETLVQVKDQRIEDLTHQIHSLRMMYERVTQQSWNGI